MSHADGQQYELRDLDLLFKMFITYGTSRTPHRTSKFEFHIAFHSKVVAHFLLALCSIVTLTFDILTVKVLSRRHFVSVPLTLSYKTVWPSVGQLQNILCLGFLGYDDLELLTLQRILTAMDKHSTKCAFSVPIRS